MLEMAMRHEPVVLKYWFRQYQWLRYVGDHIDEDAAAAWDILLDTVYQSDGFQWSVIKVYDLSLLLG